MHTSMKFFWYLNLWDEISYILGPLRDLITCVQKFSFPCPQKTRSSQLSYISLYIFRPSMFLVNIKIDNL